MKVIVTVCCDNPVGVASTQAIADELHRCGHDQDSPCCFSMPFEIDDPNKPVRQLPPRHPVQSAQLALDV